MHKSNKFHPAFLLILMVVVALVVSACQPPAAPSAEGEAPPPVAEPTTAPAPEDSPTVAPAAEAVEEQPGEGAAGPVTFTIVPEGTQARFYINEILMGQDKRVEGITPLVTGEIVVDPADPSTAQIGVIQIDARDFTTDSDRRNGAIRRFVLQSADDANRYITFTPTAIDGLPTAVTVGQPVQLSVTGDLQIRDIVRQETFEMTVTLDAENAISGVGATTVLRGDYELTIPSVPSVAGVEDEVLLEIEFRALAE